MKENTCPIAGAKLKCLCGFPRSQNANKVAVWLCSRPAHFLTFTAKLPITRPHFVTFPGMCFVCIRGWLHFCYNLPHTLASALLPKGFRWGHKGFKELWVLLLTWCFSRSFPKKMKVAKVSTFFPGLRLRSSPAASHRWCCCWVAGKMHSQTTQGEGVASGINVGLSLSLDERNLSSFSPLPQQIFFLFEVVQSKIGSFQSFIGLSRHVISFILLEVSSVCVFSLCSEVNFK